MKPVIVGAALIAAVGCSVFALHAAPPSSAEMNKKLVHEFFTAFAMRDKATLAKIVREDYIQHAPQVETGLQGIYKVIDRMAAAGPAVPPPADLGIVREVSEGNMVAVEVRRMTPQGVRADADFIRIQDGKIAEHWGVQQMVPPEDQAANKNGFF